LYEKVMKGLQLSPKLRLNVCQSESDAYMGHSFTNRTDLVEN